MEFKIGNIVKHIGSGQILEITGIVGKLILCKPLDMNAHIPYKQDELEIIMEEETEAFNILFKDDEES